MPNTPATSFRPLRRAPRLLVEQPGPWGPSGDIRDSSMPARVAEELVQWARESGAAIDMIRRGARAGQPSSRRCLVISPGQAAPAIRAHTIDDPRRLLDRLHGEIGERCEPVFVTLPRSGRDRLGRRRDGVLLGSLREAGVDAWEISRLEGARSAVAVGVFPEGALYDALGPASAPAIVTAHGRGEVALAWWRGRVGDDWEVRVAEHLVRRSTGRLGCTDVTAVAVARHGDDEATVRVVMRGAGAVEVRVRRAVADAVGRPACAGTCAAVERYELVSLRVVGEGAGSTAAVAGAVARDIA